ncbi:MAG: hypothetical protein AAF602_05465 [Myxococcota bacterium]
MIGLVTLVVLVVGASVAVSKSRPSTGLEGPSSRALVEQIRDAVAQDAWNETGAVRFTFAGRNTHLWDRQRGLSRVEWGDVVVLQRLDERVGRVWRNDREVTGKRRDRLIEKAWSSHINDTFWLQPFANLDDAGVTKSIVELSGTRGLLVEYASGGVTPGDAYWWELDPETGRPRAWRMWVQIIPIGGVRASWDGWVQLPTGAWISTSHDIGPARIQITELTGATSLDALGYDEDPFAPLLSVK